MMKPSLAVLLVLALPGAAFAQANTSPGSTSAAGPSATGNLNNPQAQANQAGQPALAHSVPSSGDAARIPTPVINGQTMSSPIPQAAKPPTSNAIR